MLNFANCHINIFSPVYLNQVPNKAHTLWLVLNLYVPTPSLFPFSSFQFICCNTFVLPSFPQSGEKEEEGNKNTHNYFLLHKPITVAVVKMSGVPQQGKRQENH